MRGSEGEPTIGGILRSVWLEIDGTGFSLRSSLTSASVKIPVPLLGVGKDDQLLNADYGQP